MPPGRGASNVGASLQNNACRIYAYETWILSQNGWAVRSQKLRVAFALVGSGHPESEH